MSQHNPQEMFDEAIALVQYMHPVLTAPIVDQHYIINMDQTTVYFLMAPRNTLNLRGESTIHIASTDGSTTRVSVNVGVTASGKLFKPMLTSKGAPVGQIALREFLNYTNRDKCLLTCQRKPWVDEEDLMKWIHDILPPYLEVSLFGMTGVGPSMGCNRYHKYLVV